MSRAKQSFLAFDTVAAKAIGRLPKSFYGFFAAVGLVIRPAFWIAVAVMAAIYFRTQNQPELMLAAIFSAALVPLNAVLKTFFKRQRPVTIYTEAMKVKSYSFPSSHSYSAGLVASFLVVAISLNSSLIISLLSGAILGLIVITVAVSRIFVGAHYPSDVTGGVLLGLAVQAIIFSLTNL